MPIHKERNLRHQDDYKYFNQTTIFFYSHK